MWGGFFRCKWMTWLSQSRSLGVLRSPNSWGPLVLDFWLRAFGICFSAFVICLCAYVYFSRLACSLFHVWASACVPASRVYFWRTHGHMDRQLYKHILGVRIVWGEKTFNRKLSLQCSAVGWLQYVIKYHYHPKIVHYVHSIKNMFNIIISIPIMVMMIWINTWSVKVKLLKWADPNLSTIEQLLSFTSEHLKGRFGAVCYYVSTTILVDYVLN